MSANNYSIVALALLVACAAGLAIQQVSAASSDDQAAPNSNVRTDIGRKLPPLFDFQKYRQFFKKTYRGLREELNRARLFFARAFRVFIARIRYLHGLSNKYLAINHMSDWTPSERNAMQFGLKLGARREATSSSGRQTILAADLETIEKKLAELAERKELRAEQLEPRRRARRDTAGRLAATPARRELPDEQVFRNPSKIVQEVSPKLVRYVPSNNPDHREPELPSQLGSGGDEDESMPANEITEEEHEQIEAASSSGAALDKLDRSLLNAAGGSTRENAPTTATATAPKDEILLDYRGKNCFTSIKDQGVCNSCYIFAPMAIYEYFYCMQTGKLVQFSEQYVLDCGAKSGLKGCRRGMPAEVVDFTLDFGLELGGEYYAYKGEQSSCPYDLDARPELAGHIRLMSNESKLTTVDNVYDELIEYLVKTKGPVVLAMLTNDEFLDYGGGVDLMEDADPDSGHGIALIGFGVENGRRYWLLRNSYGIDWGEKGHHKLDRETDPFNLMWVDFLKVRFEGYGATNGTTAEPRPQPKQLREKFLGWMNKVG